MPLHSNHDVHLENYATLHDRRSSYTTPSTLPRDSDYHDHQPTATITTPTGADCDRRRPEEAEHSRMVNMSTSLISQTVTPFLREHIPTNYAPISKVEGAHDDTSVSMDNSKFCYRHHPDSKCRKAADENKMVMIQRVCPTKPLGVLIVDSNPLAI
jgi:hypothetical protein